HDASNDGWCRAVEISKLTKIGAAVMGRQEVHETLVVARRNAEQLKQRTVISGARAEAAANQLTNVVPRDVPLQEERVDVLPEGIPAVQERMIELVGNLTPSLAHRQDRLSR